MSDAYQSQLVDDGGTTYEQFAVGVVAASFAAFALAAGTLFGWVPVADQVGGVSGGTLFGAGVLALGVATAGLGAVSRWGGAQTAPDHTPGLVVGLAQATLWTLALGLFAGNTIGLGGIGWLVALPVGTIAGYATIGAREDVGATIPTAAFVCFVGAVILAGLITPEWTWEPAAFDAVFPGTIVIPLLTMVSSLLTGWAGATAYEGYGMRGRQNGAFMLISLVVLLVLSVLAYLLIFVFERGIMVVLENLTIGAGTALLFAATALALVVRYGHLQPTTADGVDKVTSFVHLSVAVLLGLGALRLLYTVVTGQSITGYAVTVDPTAVVGAVPGLLFGLVLLAVFHESWTPETRMGRQQDRVLTVSALLLGLGVAIEVIQGGELAAFGIAFVPTLTFLVAGLAGLLFAVGGASRLAGRQLPAWVPPVTRSGTLTLWAFVVLCLHVVVTGFPLGGAVGIAVRGTVNWPFVMNPSQGLGIQPGVMPAMLGTIWIVLGAVVFAVPFAVGAAVFLTEYAEDSLFTRAVDIATNGLWSTPSIVFGLFGLAFLVPRFGGSPSIFAAQLVLGFMLLPLVLITSREALKSVPDEYRDASAALGVSKWETIKSVVVPAAMPGVTTGVILGVGRIAGETAPLLLVLNGPNFPNSAPGVLSSFTFRVGMEPPFVHVSNPALLERASALPYQLYAIITAGVGAEESFGWGTALVLLGVVLSFFAMGIVTRRYFRRKLHQ